MQCENCREREAVIHLTQIVNNSVTTMHLCEPCAAEKGVETGSSVAKFPLGDFLASLGKGGGSEPAGEAGLDVLHGSTRHEGESYRTGTVPQAGRREPVPAGVGGKGGALNDLRDALRKAIEAENFELAAELRDKIRVLE
jgi:protein arginine kinase activator